MTRIRTTSEKTLGCFTDHGVDFGRETGSELIGDCPFCGKPSHFYVNRENGCWDCKRCGASGNPAQFLARVHSRVYLPALTQVRLAALAKNRCLPVEAFEPWDIGYDETNDRYTVLVKDLSGNAVDLRTWEDGPGFLSTTGCSVGLFGLHRLSEHEGEPIYLFEGEWDAMAFAWLLRKLAQPGAVLGVPGAGTFKKLWLPHFAGRAVYLLYDHDDAGREGEQKVWRMLRDIAASLACVHWPDEQPRGYDVRDHIVKMAVREKKPKAAYRALQALFREEPRLKPDRVAVPANASTLEALKERYVYSNGTKRFVDRVTLNEYDKEQFSDRYAVQFPLGGRLSAATQLLTGGCQQVASPTYRPNADRLVEETVKGHTITYVNLWTPPDLVIEPGDITPYLSHVAYLIPDEAERHVHLDWIAFNLLRPDLKINWALLLGGPAGVGKDLMFHPLREGLGRQNHRAIMPDDLTSGYTDWLRHIKLVVVDTMHITGKRALMDRLKPWIAAPPDHLRINGKYQPHYEIPNLASFLFMANRPDALALDADDRRFFVYWIEAEPKPPDYYRELWEWSRANVGAIVHYFLHEHVLSKGFNALTPPPMTGAKREMIRASESPLLQSLRSAWDECRPPLERELVTVEHVRRVLKEQDGRPYAPHAIAQALKVLGGRLVRQLNVGGQRPRVWAMARFQVYNDMLTAELVKEYQRQSNLPFFRAVTATLVVVRKKRAASGPSKSEDQR